MISSSIFNAAMGAIIRVERQKRGLSQADVASSIGVSYQQLHKYEQGKNGLSAYRLAQLAAAFSFPADYFINQALSKAASARVIA